LLPEQENDEYRTPGLKLALRETSHSLSILEHRGAQVVGIEAEFSPRTRWPAFCPSHVPRAKSPQFLFSLEYAMTGGAP
jgi:hypothetical protein